MTFIETEFSNNPGDKGEKRVWDSVKNSYNDKKNDGKCTAYWKYPLFTSVGQNRKEPDILIADKDHGITIIEIKSLRINQLVAVNGHIWQYKDFYEEYGNPYKQAEDQLFSLLSILDRESELRRQIRGRVLIALPFISEEEWISKGFDKLPGVPPIIFSNDLGKSPLLQKINSAANIQTGNDLDENRWKILLSVLGGNPVHRKEIVEGPLDPTTKIGIINTLTNRLSEMDIQQELIGKVIPPGPQRIRGIAGSGKSVLIAQRAAHMHLKHPEWDIALVFFSRSLYDEVINQVDKWLRHFSNGDVCYDDNVKVKLKVLHAWGAKNRPGFYSLICASHGVTPLIVNDIKDKGISGIGNSIGYICAEFLRKKIKITPLFDAILIDEGQDLMVLDAYKYEDKQPFYWLAYSVLRPIDSEDTINRRLTWAYDESQSLDNLTIPTSRELFGDDPQFRNFVAGNHKGGVRKSEIMHRCYRTPGPILTAAHAIGMGLLRPEGMLRGITNKEDWKNIGYEVLEGNFRTGETIVLQRPAKNSPNLVPSLSKEPVLTFKTYSSREEELNALAHSIKNNIENDGLSLDKHILIIILGENGEAGRLQKEVAQALMNNNIDIYLPSMPRKNTLSADWRNQNPDKFNDNDAVTISLVPRAKGNEATMVYAIGADSVGKNEANIQLRNQLFVALTRSRGWANLSGIGDYPFYDEVNDVINSGDTFKFEFRKAPIQNINEELELAKV